MVHDKMRVKNVSPKVKGEFSRMSFSSTMQAGHYSSPQRISKASLEADPNLIGKKVVMNDFKCLRLLQRRSLSLKLVSLSLKPLLNANKVIIIIMIIMILLLCWLLLWM